MNTEQKICPYCGKAFTENDDIVVCPDCGTRHHRACWAAHGHCANEAHHGEPIPTEDSNTHTHPDANAPHAPQDAPNARICPRCGYQNAPDALFCSGCGLPLGASGAGDSFFAQQAHGFDPASFNPDVNFSNDTDFDGVPSTDAARLIGKNTEYYLPVFSRLHRNNRGRFHFCAFLFGGGWMLFRKQYVRGGIMLALQVLLDAAQMLGSAYLVLPVYQALLQAAGIDLNAVVGGTLTQEQAMRLAQEMMQLPAGRLLVLMLPILLAAAALVLRIVIGACANRWYYRDTLAVARCLRARHSDESMLIDAETRRGGVNMPLAICLLVCAVILRFVL